MRDNYILQERAKNVVRQIENGCVDPFSINELIKELGGRKRIEDIPDYVASTYLFGLLAVNLAESANG